MSTKRALGFVYVGYSFRYLYLLVLIPFYGRVLGTDAYGRLVAAMSLFQVVWLLTEYGFPAIGSRDVAIADERSRADLYGQHMLGRITMCGLSLSVGLLGTYLSPILREDPLSGVLATLSGIVAGFNLGWYFQGIQRFRTSVLLEVMSFAINLPLILSLVRTPSDGWLVMMSLLVSGILCTGTAHFIALGSMERATLRLHGAVPLIRASTALFIHRGVGALMASASTYLISLFATAGALGLYGAAERLVSAGLSLMQPANQVLVGTVSGLLDTERGIARAFLIIRKALVVMTGLGLVMVLGTWLFGHLIVPFVLGPAFAEAVPILKVMALLFPFAAVAQVVSTYVLVPFRRDYFLPIVSVSASVVTLILIFALGPTYAGVGVAWARVAGQIVAVGLLLMALHRAGLSKRLFGL